MKIDKKAIKTHIEKEIQVASYSADDIRKLIALDIEKQGYKVDLSGISFITKWRYVSDEWGMNTTIVTTFDGAKAEVK